MNNYTIGNNETTITLPLDALTAQLKMQGLTLLLNHELPAFAAPPPASEGEWYPGKDYQRLSNRIGETNGIALESDMNEIIRIVHEDFPATLPTREPEVKEKFAVRFSEWLMIQCDYKNHCVWEYQGEEYTQQELIEIFKRNTPSLPTQSITY